jgi:hypothetical protein
MNNSDICPSRDDAQPHLWERGRCVLCLAPQPMAPPQTAEPSWVWVCGMRECRENDKPQVPDDAMPGGLPRCRVCRAAVVQRKRRDDDALAPV